MGVGSWLKSSRAVIAILATLVVVSALSSLAIYSTLSTRLAIEQQRSGDVINRQTNELGRFSTAWGNQLTAIRSVEPDGLAKSGVFRARIVKASADGRITVDWLGYSRDAQTTNDSTVTQMLRPGPLADVFTLLVSGDGRASQLVPYDLRELSEAIDRKTISGQQMLEADWWITVDGEGSYGLLVQAL